MKWGAKTLLFCRIRYFMTCCPYRSKCKVQNWPYWAKLERCRSTWAGASWQPWKSCLTLREAEGKPLGCISNHDLNVAGTDFQPWSRTPILPLKRIWKVQLQNLCCQTLPRPSCKSHSSLLSFFCLILAFCFFPPIKKEWPLFSNMLS